MGVGNRPSRDRRTEQRENRLPALRQPPSCRGGSPYADRLTRPVCQMESGDPDACERYPEPTSSAQSAATWPPPPKTASTSSTPSPNSPRDTPGYPKRINTTSIGRNHLTIYTSTW